LEKKSLAGVIADAFDFSMPELILDFKLVVGLGAKKASDDGPNFFLPELILDAEVVDLGLESATALLPGSGGPKPFNVFFSAGAFSRASPPRFLPARTVSEDALPAEPASSSWWSFSARGAELVEDAFPGQSFAVSRQPSKSNGSFWPPTEASLSMGLAVFFFFFCHMTFRL